MKRYKGEAGLLLVAMIWGSGFIAGAIGLDYLTPYQAMAGRFFVSSLLLDIVFFKRLKGIRIETLRKGIIIGVFLFGAFLLQTLGLELTTPSRNAFLTAVNVVIVPFLGFILLKKRLNWKETAGAILALIGVGVLSLDLSGSINPGDFLSFLCSIAFAFHIFFTGLYSQEESAIELTVIQMNVSFLLSAIVLAARGGTMLGAQPEGYAAIVYLGVFSTTIAFFLQTYSQKFTNETRAAVIMSTEALFATVFSVIVFSEVISTRMIIGAILIFTAILFPMVIKTRATDHTEAAEGL